MALGSLITLLFLFSTGRAYSEASSSRCPTTSVAGVPGCWGTPECTYVTAKNLSTGALCGCDYCNCGGVAVPLLPTVIAGTSTVGCNYPTQPTSSNCPNGTETGPIPTLEPGSPGLPPSDATVITGTVEGGTTVTRTFVLTTYTELATLTILSTVITTETELISTVTSNGQNSTTVVLLPTPVTSTITVGPSGVAWVPFSTSSGAPPLPPPTFLPGSKSTVISSSTNGGTLSTSSGDTVPSSTNEGPPPASSSNTVPSSTNAGPSPASSSNTVPPSTNEGPPPASSSNTVPSSTNGASPPASSSNTVPSSTNEGPPPASSSNTVPSSINAGPPPASSSNTVPSSTNGGSPPASSSNTVPSNTNDPVPPITSNPRPTSSDDVPPLVITSFDIAILTLTSIAPSISENTAISTSDGKHPIGLYPFIRGGPKCFFCPPGVDNGGFFLWGMNKPGVYPPPVPPPVPNVPWPTITIGPGNKPTPGPKPGTEQPDDPQSSKKPEDPQESQKPGDPQESRKPGDPQESQTPGDPQESQTSESCPTTTASSCAVSCTTPSGQSTESCTTTKCETTSGCSVTNTASTTTKSGSCSPTGWANLPDGNEDPSGSDGGEEGPDPSYDGSVPAWVTAWPSETGTMSSKASSGGASTITSVPHNFCVHYLNPKNGDSYCTCDDQKSRSFLDDKGNCPTTSQASGVIPEPTPEQPKTDGNGNIWNSTDIVEGTIWGCKSTSIKHGVAPGPITECLSSSSIGMKFTPSSAAPEPTSTPAQPTEPKEECDECSTDMGASSCGPDDDDCLVNECKANGHCKACGIDCSTFVSGSLIGKRDVLSARAINSARLQQMSNKLSRRKMIDPTPLAHIADLDRPRSLDKRVEPVKPIEHTPAWKEFAPKGLKYYKMLQEKPMQDVIDPKMCELDDYFTVDPGKLTTPRLKNYLLEKIGVTPTNSYYGVMAHGPQKGKSKNGEIEDSGEFQETISAEQGILFANSNDRGEKKDSKGVVTQKPVPYQMSTVVWWMWKHTVMRGQDPTIKEEDTDFSNFKYFFRVNIKNDKTKDILIEALGKNTEPMEFTPKDDGLDNAFWPLLGSPNGNGIAWFLADHKKSLKGKGIEKITAWRRGEDYHFWATIK